MVDCCIAAQNANAEKENWTNYMADALATIINMFSSKGKMPRYWDLVHNEAKQDERTSDEIILDIIKRHGLKVVSK